MSDVVDVTHLFKCSYFFHTHMGDECHRPDDAPPCSRDCPDRKTYGDGWSGEHYPTGTWGKMKENNAQLNNKYRVEGWGRVTDLALGIEPADVEMQARTVARWAYTEIERLRDNLEKMRLTAETFAAEVERLRAQVNTNWISDRAIHRSDALEEAAKWLEECEGQEIADAIRALKEKSDE
jgi:hypothetical protein